MSDILQAFAALLPENGDAVPFEQFIQAVRTAGLPARDWLKAKHRGVIIAEFDANGQHVIRRNPLWPN